MNEKNVDMMEANLPQLARDLILIKGRAEWETLPDISQDSALHTLLDFIDCEIGNYDVEGGQLLGIAQCLSSGR